MCQPALTLPTVDRTKADLIVAIKLLVGTTEYSKYRIVSKTVNSEAIGKCRNPRPKTVANNRFKQIESDYHTWYP